MANKILIVDDNPNMSSLLSEMLEVFEYDSTIASDGLEALDELEADKYAMVITDMRMPNMSGMELLAKVKETHPQIKVVLISGYTSGEVEAQAQKLKADGFIGKPLMMADIERLLSDLL
jgi:DNA-binding NtrC family response regulator